MRAILVLRPGVDMRAVKNNVAHSYTASHILGVNQKFNASRVGNVNHIKSASYLDLGTLNYDASQKIFETLLVFANYLRPKTQIESASHWHECVP